MKRLFILTAFLTALVGCQSVDSNVMDPSSEAHGRESLKAIEFSIKDTSATKSPTPITSLSEFNVTATSGSAGKEVAKIDNVVFADKNKSGVFRGDALWPTSDPGYHFYASNVAMTHTAFGQTVTISSIDKDVVCAYLQNPSYKVKNDLMFNHILARVGTVSFMNLSLCTDVKLSMKYSGSGTYNLLTGLWSGLGSRSTKELTAADNDFWIIPGTYDATLTYVDANGTPQSKTISQEFKAGLVNNITAKLDGNVIVKTEDVYSEPTFELGSISDVPASGGDSDKPSVTNVGQQKRLKTTFADGREEYDEWEPVNSPDYTIQYGKTLSALTDDCPTYHGDNLGTTAKARTKLGDIYVRVKIGDEITDKTLEVYQEANEETLGDLSIKSFSYSPKVGAAGGTASPTVTYELPYSWTSGSNGKYTTDATLAYTTVTDNAGATLDASTGVVTWAANTGNERSEKERVTVSLKGKESRTDATSTQSGDSVDHYDNPTVELTYSGTPIAYNSTSAISPTLVVKQKVYYVSGATDTKTLSAGDYTVSYSGSATGLSVNSSTGAVTPSSNAGSTIAAKTVYDDPTVTFSYSPASLSDAGGTSSPSVSYSQTGTYYAAGRNKTDSRSTTVTAQVTAHNKQNSGTATVSQDGDGGQIQATSAITPVTTGGIIKYDGSATGFTLSTDGKVTAAANEGDARSITVTATVTVNDKTGTKTAKVEQEKVSDSVDYYDAPTGLSISCGDIPASGGTISEGTVSGKATQVVHYKSGKTSTIDVNVTYDKWTPVIASSLGTTAKNRTKVGTLILTYSANDKSNTASCDVYQAKNYIKNNEVSLSQSTIDKGSTCTATYSGVWASGSAVTGYWSSDDTNVASVSGSSKTATVTGKGAGETWINFDPDGGDECYARITVNSGTIVKTEDDTDWDYQYDEWNTDYWVKINGKTSDSKSVGASSGSVTVTATAGHTHHSQLQERSRPCKKYTWSDGSVTYGGYGSWSSWSNVGSATTEPKSGTPDLSSDASWLRKSGSYDANTSTSSRSATIKATYGGASATLTVTQDAGASDEPTIIKTETDTGTDTRNNEWDDGYWAKINGKTSDSKTVGASSGSVTVTATAGYTHHVQPQKRSRTRDKYTWSDGSVTYGDWGDWSSWSNNGSATTSSKSGTPTLTSNATWLKTSGSYDENKNTSSRTATITASYEGASATLTVTQEGKDDYDIDVN